MRISDWSSDVCSSDLQRIEQVKFADGTVWTHADLMARTTNPTSSNDNLFGTSAANTIDALAGNDMVTSWAGADTLTGNDGNDTLIGGVGDDSLSGGAGDDVFQITGTGEGYDAIDGGAGDRKSTRLNSS